MSPLQPILALALLATLCGCADVQPWERGVLAKPHMAIEPLAARSALRSHVQSSREAVGTSGSAEGGGCGCY